MAYCECSILIVTRNETQALYQLMEQMLTKSKHSSIFFGVDELGFSCILNLLYCAALMTQTSFYSELPIRSTSIQSAHPRSIYLHIFSIVQCGTICALRQLYGDALGHLSSEATGEDKGWMGRDGQQARTAWQLVFRASCMTFSLSFTVNVHVTPASAALW